MQRITYHALFFLVPLLTSSFFCNAEQEAKANTCNEFVQKIMEHNLNTLDCVDEAWPNEEFYDFLNRCWDYQINLAPQKKRRTVFKIIKNHVELFQTKTNQILDDTVTWDDLNLFRGSNDPENYFVARIDRTQTELGKVTLCFLISQPTKDVSLLTERQSILQEFIHDQDLSTSAIFHLQELKKTENLVYSFWANDPFKQALERQYFSVPHKKLNETMNHEETSLFLNSSYEHIKRFTWFATTAASIVILPLYGLSQLTALPGPPENIKNFLTYSSQPALGFVGSLKIFNHYLLQSFIAIAAGLYSGVAVKNTYEWLRDNFRATMFVQKKLIALSDFLQHTRQLYQVVAQNTLLRKKLKSFQALEDLCGPDAIISPNLQKLFDLLEMQTFTEPVSIFAHHGRILSAFRLMHEVRKELEPAFCAIGEIDAYLSTAQLYQEYEMANVRYSFVRYLEQDTPSIKLENFWNPFIDSHKVITNSLSIGRQDGAHIIVVTGPNAGGKSTLIKGIALSFILAQTFGLAPATSCTLTPISSIATYLNITDDIATGNSLFKAQVLRVEKLLSQARKLAPNEFWFVAFDEIFTGTSSKEGQALSYSLVKDLATHTNNLCIVATHFPLLKQLETINSSIANYKVSAEIDPLGRIYYPFTLQRGTSTQNIAVDILRAEGFKSSILDEASAIIQNTP